MVPFEGIAPTRLTKETSFTDWFAYFNELKRHVVLGIADSNCGSHAPKACMLTTTPIPEIKII